ncbi:hypothetical protein PCH_Pc16g08940 [Penicillium rubens Wisconsin 54-1255]|uniref:Uncharacterized protein n=1 Tax=Penicillium rubens (strain ATCC 28089 / DSM 1075 / NRRL 1951 / Wisconsin 54-1255) TaxID=500485 RepID=B6H8N5_PENRW|nr:hypothetical protein PCH_Pc16g08940 [Penicillium rubens Wisconsin 54-1255]
MVDSVVLGSISNVLRLSSRGTLRRGMTSGTRIQTWQMEQPGINRKIICSGRTENDATQRQGLHSKLPVERQLANEIDEEANYLFLDEADIQLATWEIPDFLRWIFAVDTAIVNGYQGWPDIMF